MYYNEEENVTNTNIIQDVHITAHFADTVNITTSTYELKTVSCTYTDKNENQGHLR